MIDVLENIKDLLNFESEDDFYYLQIIQRKKDNPHIGSNSRIIKNYYVNNLDYLLNLYDEIKGLCIQFNARAMLRLNKRSYRKVAFKAMQNIANSMMNDEYSFIRKSYDRACGNGHNDKNKYWIIDIDGEYEESWLSNLKNYISNCRPIGNKIVRELETKNGLHIISTPFDLRKFKEDYLGIDIHKDNPINLFIP